MGGLITTFFPVIILRVESAPARSCFPPLKCTNVHRVRWSWRRLWWLRWLEVSLSTPWHFWLTPLMSECWVVRFGSFEFGGIMGSFSYNDRGWLCHLNLLLFGVWDATHEIATVYFACPPKSSVKTGTSRVLFRYGLCSTSNWST